MEDSNFDVPSILLSWHFRVRIPSKRVRFQMFRHPFPDLSCLRKFRIYTFDSLSGSLFISELTSSIPMTGF